MRFYCYKNTNPYIGPCWYRRIRNNCPMGPIGLELLDGCCKILSPDGNPNEYFKHIFREFDKNNDNTTNFSEVAVAERYRSLSMLTIYCPLLSNSQIGIRQSTLALNSVKNDTLQEKLTWSFKIYDVDENWFIALMKKN